VLQHFELATLGQRLVMDKQMLLYGDIYPPPDKFVVRKNINHDESNRVALNRTAYLLTEGKLHQMIFLQSSSSSSYHASIFWTECARKYGFEDRKDYLKLMKEECGDDYPVIFSLVENRRATVQISSVVINAKIDSEQEELVRKCAGTEALAILSLNLLQSRAQYSKHEMNDSTVSPTPHFLQYPPIELSRLKSTEGWELKQPTRKVKNINVKVHAVCVDGVFKHKYGNVANACERRLRTLQDIVKPPKEGNSDPLYVLYLSSLQSGHWLSSDLLKRLSDDQKNAVEKQLSKEYGFTTILSTVSSSPAMRPARNTSIFVLITAADPFHEDCKKQLENDLTVAHRVQISSGDDKECADWDMSNFIRIPTYSLENDPATAASEVLAELQDRIAYPVAWLERVKTLSLRENELEWASDKAVFTCLLSMAKSLRILEKLDLSLNPLSGDAFCNWVVSMARDCPTLTIIDLRGGYCPMSLSQFKLDHGSKVRILL
jgi:hypothetical protein